MPRTKKKQKTKNSKGAGFTKEIEARLDKITSQIILNREKRCFTCSSGSNLVNGHLLERRHRNTRWDTHSTGNCHNQCNRCNSNHEPHPEVYRERYIVKFGEGEYNALCQRAHSNHKFTAIELEDILKQKEAELKELQNELPSMQT